MLINPPNVQYGGLGLALNYNWWLNDQWQDQPIAHMEQSWFDERELRTNVKVQRYSQIMFDKQDLKDLQILQELWLGEVEIDQKELSPIGDGVSEWLGLRVAPSSTICTFWWLNIHFELVSLRI